MMTHIANHADVKMAAPSLSARWAQLSLVTFFLVLYTVAPKTSAGTDFMPVPWVLGTYLAFTVARLIAAYRCALPTWTSRGVSSSA